MSSSLLLPYLVLAATLVRALVNRTSLAAPSCARCGLGVERKHLGERICSCR